jgi:[acyl-carrier-protein] S-malonyltransferase
VLIMTAPGQGAQTPGFLAPWLELPGVAERLGSWSELAGIDLVRMGTTADADEITDTSVAQPLLVAAALLVAEQLATGLDGSGSAGLDGYAGAGPDTGPDIAAGHSVGELAAGAIAGVLSPEDAIRLTGVRGRAMAEATRVTPTGMTAVLGGNEGDVLAAIARHGLTPANINAKGQIVAGGTLEQLAAFAADPPEGARLRTLRVAGAFHTTHMAPAVEVLANAASDAVVKDPSITLLSNRDGGVVTSGKDWLERVVAQIAAPVRWDLCMDTMASLSVTALLELPPAGTLTGVARRALPGVKLLALKTPDQLDAARSLIGEHAAANDQPPGHSPSWRIVVAPGSGTFRYVENGVAGTGTDAGATVRAGADLGLIEARGGPRPVTAPCDGVLVEWLAEDGDPVSEGQPIARFEPAELEPAQ